ncbi:unnamed protein product [Linum trigynum]|uniref:Uncharacterized protein n=1 Tax=Linum trigynum TaxID=586398 RepID=A0AAV2CGW9_9ROSI
MLLFLTFFPIVDKPYCEIPLMISLRRGATAERVQLMELLSLLPSNWISMGPARLVWPLESSSVFSVSSFTTNLINSAFGVDVLYSSKLVWISSILPRSVVSSEWHSS